jgi:polar amino acid transport system substrate-binding protein
MKMVRFFTMLAFAFLVLTPVHLISAESAMIVVASDTTWPPMEMKDKNGNITGYGVDMMKAIGQEAGVKIKIINVAWDDIFKGLDEGKYDAIMSSVTITPERQAKYDFSNSYFSAGQILVVPVESKGVNISGKTVGVLEGSTGLDAIMKQKGLKIKTYADIDKAFAEMKNHVIAGVVCDSPVAGNYTVLKDEYKGKFIISGMPFTKEDYGIVVKKGNKKLLEQINAGLEAAKMKGIDKKLEKKWLLGM